MCVLAACDWTPATRGDYILKPQGCYPCSFFSDIKNNSVVFLFYKSLIRPLTTLYPPPQKKLIQIDNFISNNKSSGQLFIVEETDNDFKLARPQLHWWRGIEVGNWEAVPWTRNPIQLEPISQTSFIFNMDSESSF